MTISLLLCPSPIKGDMKLTTSAPQYGHNPYTVYEVGAHRAAMQVGSRILNTRNRVVYQAPRCMTQYS